MRAVLFISLFILNVQLYPESAFAEGPLRAKIRERVLARMAQQDPPKARTDVTAKLDQPGDYTFTYEFGGHARYYKLHIPKSLKAPAPALVVMHGGGGDMEIQATEEYYHQISKSESEGFVAIFPNGLSQFRSMKLATWNAGACCGYARDSKAGDVGFIKDVVAKVSKQTSIDPKRVYATGMSNGGMMAYRLACEASDVFRAIASVAGTDNTTSCQPTAKVAVLHIHAKDDDHVLFNGGAGQGAFRVRSMVTDFKSVPSTIDRWVGRNECNAHPYPVLNKPGASCTRYRECKVGAEVELCVTDSGGHSWPGGKKVQDFGSKPSTAISANDVMWDFFKSLPPRP